MFSKPRGGSQGHLSLEPGPPPLSARASVSRSCGSPLTVPVPTDSAALTVLTLLTSQRPHHQTTRPYGVVLKAQIGPGYSPAEQTFIAQKINPKSCRTSKAFGKMAQATIQSCPQDARSRSLVSSSQTRPSSSWSSSPGHSCVHPPLLVPRCAPNLFPG